MKREGKTKKEKEEKAKQKQEQEQTILDPNYYLQSPIYVPRYKEDTPTLVDNLLPEPTPEEERNIATSRQTKTNDKQAGEDKVDTNKEKKGEKKQEETRSEEEDYLEESDCDLMY